MLLTKAYLIKIPSLVQKIYPEAIWNRSNKNNNVYLTFDDGPSPGATSFVLDLLKKHSAKASFFVLGEEAQKHPDLVERIKNEGHLLGIHGHTHQDGLKTNTEEYLQNVERAYKLIGSRYFRPPFGRMKNSQYQKLKKDYQIVMWDVMTGDFETNINFQRRLQYLEKVIKAGSVVVFHDSENSLPNLESMLEPLIKILKEKKFNLERVDV